MKVLNFPLTKIALAFIVGILVSNYFALPVSFVFGFSVLGIFVMLLFYFLQKAKAVAFSVLIVAFILGFANYKIQNESLYKSHFTNQKINFDSQNTVRFQIKEKLKASAKYNRYVATILSVNNKEASGKIVVNFSKQHTPNFFISDFIQAKGFLYKNNQKHNPEGFNYSLYLENKNIFGQLYLNDETILVSKNSSFTWIGFADKVAKRIENNLQQSQMESNDLQLIMALILGRQQELDPELVKEYQYAGAIHILSVSGLHIAFILWFVNLLLNRFPNTTRWRISKLIFNLSFLWIFGLLAEFSPPVLRSITMFSILIIGANINRSTNHLHNLMVSLLVLLLFNPRYLFDVGFQLSYAALLSILLFQPLFDTYWQPKNKYVKTIWQLFTVSIAAQIGTLPISLYYFHQFPALFFATNVFIYIPLSLGMIGAFLAVIWAIVAPLPIIFGKVIHCIFLSLNYIISKIASVESFVFQDISFHFVMMIALYGVIFAIYFYLQKKSFYKLRNVLLAVIVFQLSWLFVKQIKSKPEWLVFHKTGKTIITSKQVNAVTVSTSIHDFDRLKPVRDYAVAQFSEIVKIDSVTNFYSFQHKKIAVIDASAVFVPNVHPDILILRNSPKINLERYLSQNKTAQIIADGSNYKSYVKLWKATCSKRKILFHDTAEKGFYKLN